MEHRSIHFALVRLHVLHHASKEDIFGLEMIRELGRHGYSASPGTLYPLLHGMEREGYLKSAECAGTVCASSLENYLNVNLHE